MPGIQGEVPVLLVSVPTTSTGLKQYSAVMQSTSGNLIVTTLGAQALGVLQGGSTGSTVPPAVLSVMLEGITKIRTTAGATGASPNTVSAGAAGGAVAATGSIIGRIVGGSSGGADRILFMHLAGPSVAS